MAKEERPCRKCGVLFSGKACRPCARAHAKLWYQENCVSVREQQNRVRRENPDRAKSSNEKSNRKYYEKRQSILAAYRNKYANDPAYSTKMKANASKWRKENPEKSKCQDKVRRVYYIALANQAPILKPCAKCEIERPLGLECVSCRRLRDREKRLANPEVSRERDRMRYVKDPEGQRARHQSWRLANPERYAIIKARRRARQIGAIGSHSLVEWQAIVAKQRGKCQHCKLRRKLTKDHIMPLSRGGSDFAFNIQGLCALCNSKKHARVDPATPQSLFDNMGASA